MIRRFTLALCTMTLLASLAFADPEVTVSYHSGVTRVQISGNYPQSRYTISRASAATGNYVPITTLSVLCAGSCFGEDFEAQPGQTYWYRFDLTLADGNRVTFGPYEVRISPTLARGFGATAAPNPSFGPCRIEFFVPGSPNAAPVEARATLHDLQGRKVRELWRGTMPRGLTSLMWDGRDERGRTVDAGQYFLRFSTPVASRVIRISRFR